MDIRDFFYRRRRFFFVKRNLILTGLAVLLGLFIGLEIGLNVWIRSALESSLWRESKKAAVRASISWMGLQDFLSGRVSWVRVDAGNCRVGGLVYRLLKIDNKGFRFNLPVLIKERRLMVLSINQTLVHAIIQTQSLQNYLNTLYSQYQPQLAIHPKAIQLAGIVKIFGSPVPVRLVGDLQLTEPKKLHFYPSALYLGNKPVSGQLLKFVEAQIPLEFSVLEDWPLQISDFALKENYIQVTMRED